MNGKNENNTEGSVIKSISPIARMIEDVSMTDYVMLMVLLSKQDSTPPVEVKGNNQVECCPRCDFPSYDCLCRPQFMA